MNLHSPIPLKPDPAAMFAAHRRSFVNVCAVLALASKRHERPEKVLARVFPDDAVAGRILKSAMSPTTSESFAWMQTATVLPMLSPSAASARLLGLATPVDLAGVTSVGMPYIGAAGVPPVPFIGEGKPMPIVDLTASSIRIGPVKKLLIGSTLTNEVQSASANTAATIIGNALATSAQQSMDALLFSASAATDDAPAGLLNGITAIPASGEAGLQGIADDLTLLAEAVATVGISAENMIIIAAPGLATKARVLVSAKYTNTILSSPAIPRGQVIGIADGGLMSGFDGSVMIETSDEMTLHMEDTAPSDIVSGVPASPVKSIWQVDAMAVKVRGWCAWQVHPGAVAFLTGAAW
ncbi:hypothetical protein ACVMGC_007939 [Bradyrhizobium barranii subsp. barranii]|uniref:hypothetical protein n=2 Tax=Bradyrhizobium TaxID=374 RepID=UPI0003FEC669|nr:MULTISPECIES: hypothetical protein [Bradyrhizobium]MBR0877766.1 hypothetical protein [Bradyrhizobium liaoningense]